MGMEAAGTGAGFVRRTGSAGAATLTLVWLALAAFQPAAAATLTAGKPVDGHLAAGESVDYTIDLTAGQAAQLRLQQTGDAALRLQLGGDADVPGWQTDAGRGSWLRIALLAAGETPARLRLSASQAADYRLQLQPAHPATDEDRLQAAAMRALAAAQHDADSHAPPAQVLASFGQADQAAREAGSACTRLRIAVDESRYRYRLGDYPAAQAAAARALLLPCPDDPAQRGAAEHALGVALAVQGQRFDAIAAEQRALALARQTGNRDSEARILGNLSGQYRLGGETQKALETAEAALKLARALGDAQRIAFVELTIADVYLSRSTLMQAVAGYRRTLAQLAQTPFPLVAGYAWTNLGLAAFKLGDEAQADAAWDQAWTICAQSADWSCQALVLADRADARYFRDRIDDALSDYRQALQISQAHHLQLQAAYATGGLGACDMKRGRWAQARAQLRQARAQMHRVASAREEGYADIQLGDLDAAQGRAADARRDYTEARRLARSYGDLGGESLALASLAHVELQAGRPAAAWQAIDASLAIVEAQRNRIVDPGLRSSYFASYRDYYALAIEVQMRLESLRPGAGHAAQALLLAERARARVLQDSLIERALAPQREVDPQLLAAQREAEEHEQLLAYQLATVPPADAAQRRRLQRDIDVAAQAVDAARGRLRAANPRYADLVDPPPPTLDGLQSLLDADTALLEFWLGDRRSELWIVSRDGLRHLSLPPRAQIEPLVDRLRSSLLPAAAQAGASIAELAAAQARPDEAVQAILQDLSQQLKTASWASLHQQRLAIVADGELQRLPFALLVDEHRRLGVAHTLVELPSAQTLRWLRRENRETVSPRLAVFADPVFRADDPRLPAAAPQAGALAALPSLPQSRKEAESLAALLPAAQRRLELGFDASRDTALAMHWVDYGIDHFATHALIDSQHPELSGIVLSLYDRQGRPRDGFLRINDIYDLDMPAELVVLSTCDSAGGRSAAGEGIYSLSRAFFYAGARRVLATLWPVDDRAGAAFMQAFYQRLLQHGQTPAQALRSAQAEIAAQPRWAGPYYWAGYVLQGDW